MLLNNGVNNLYLMMSIWIINGISAISYNRPKFCPHATWNTNGIAIANGSVIGTQPYGLFVSRNNTVYATGRSIDRIEIWGDGGAYHIKSIPANLSHPLSIFVTDDGNIYADNGRNNHRVDLWTMNASYNIPVMRVNHSCAGLFVDTNNTLYCSIWYHHQVIKKPLNSSTDTTAVAAGTGCAGFLPDMLHGPCGIVVDFNFTLFVADCWNNRIQRFEWGQLNGTTVAGNGAPGTVVLNCPIGIAFDEDNYLFIVDRGSSRIFASNIYGFRCILGCPGAASASNRLNSPETPAFDTYGNLFVTDGLNNRTQKFFLATNSCGNSMNPIQLTTSPTVPVIVNETYTFRQQGISFNRPKFCSNASWYPYAITFVNSSLIGGDPFGIFIDMNNTVYAYDRSNGGIRMWLNGSVDAMKTINSGSAYMHGLFVTDIGDIYVDNSNGPRVDKWIAKKNISVTEMYVSNVGCVGLFVDINNTLYCSTWNIHQVTAKSMNNGTSTIKTVAGTGCAGAASNMLHSPHGIFVDTDFKLYVTDAGNDRIQLFEWGQRNGTTVAGNRSSQPFSLDCPTGVVLDRDKFLFIADRYQHRIVRQNSYGFYCVVGCAGNGSAPNQLFWPQMIQFDSYGNMFVTDRFNHRIQKFLLATNSCEETTLTTIQSTTALSTMLTTTELSSYASNPTRPTYFTPASCPNSSYIGIYCNVSNAPCDTLKPCQNNGSCINQNKSSYLCICPVGFTGAECQIDNRPCKPHTCWNHGNCTEVTNDTFRCTCAFGWAGIRCETMINYCDNVTCQNRGVCRPLLGSYKCECLGESFSGEHCENTATHIVVRQVVSKSFAFIAILALVIVVGFIVVMDILKYGFGIDPTRDELERIRRQKRMKRAKPPEIVRYTYVNAPPESEQQISTKEETTTV